MKNLALRKNTEAKKPEFTFDELGMVEISDQSLLELIGGGMATLEATVLADTGGGCNTTNNGQCQTGH